MAKETMTKENGHAEYVRAEKMDKMMAADILAEATKQHNRLKFVLILAAVLSSAYVLREAILAPSGPQREPNSVLCLRAGGAWRPETHVKGYAIDAYCDRLLPCQQPPPQSGP